MDDSLKIKFIIKKDFFKDGTTLIYRKNDFSFDVEPIPPGSQGSLCINELQFEIDEEGNVLYAWGYCPLIKAIETTQKPMDYFKGTLKVLTSKKIIPGTSLKVNTERWSVSVNQKEGWVGIGKEQNQNSTAVEFAPSTVAILSDDELIGLWFRPKFVL